MPITFRHAGLSLALLLAAGTLAPQSQAQTAVPAYVLEVYGAPPPVPSGPLSDDLAAAARVVFQGSIAPVGSVSRTVWSPAHDDALAVIAASGDPRLAWPISDLMRFAWQAGYADDLANAAGTLLGKSLDRRDPWSDMTDHLMAWEIPAPPNYLSAKRAIFTNALPGWDALFVEGDIDWRFVSWGGVPIDARPYDQTDQRCNCIPAADNPEVTSAEDATWLDDDDIVFGIEVNGEYRAYPRQIMEVREMVNDTLGGRDLGIPYCTLCGAAQAYFTDDVPPGVERPVLRTTGLLIRSNKVMYDITSNSVFDTFHGNAVTGPLAEKGVVLRQASVVTTQWGAWKAAHPQTTVLAEHLALGRDFDFRNGRDANGPIFPIGDVDPRLPVQEDVVGVITPSGQPIAFPRARALETLRAGGGVASQNVRLVLDAGGLRATQMDGSPLPSHEAFWFAWSQFHPSTVLWPG
ncbi:MAG: DUF3179 domain-containing (seleno)protein [Pseudomonadota bacterium]